MQNIQQEPSLWTFKKSYLVNLDSIAYTATLHILDTTPWLLSIRKLCSSQVEGNIIVSYTNHSPSFYRSSCVWRTWWYSSCSVRNIFETRVFRLKQPTTYTYGYTIGRSRVLSYVFLYRHCLAVHRDTRYCVQCVVSTFECLHYDITVYIMDWSKCHSFRVDLPSQFKIPEYFCSMKPGY